MNILVIRLSAIGDVAMTIPVLYSAAKAYPDHTFTILTQTNLVSMFTHHPSNVQVLGINIKKSEKNLLGLYRFTQKLIRQKYDKVIDLHDVIRSRIICAMFRLHRVPIFRYRKNREERVELTRRDNKKLHQLPWVTDLYNHAFAEAGFKFENIFTTLFADKPADLGALGPLGREKTGHWIGIAPFAKHRGKIYPVDYMEKVIEQLSQQEDITIYLFGGKGEEEIILTQWASRYPRTISVVGRYSLYNELVLMSRLDLLLCMDSANMHFASLVGTRVLSIWGATHPYTGFYGYHQNMEDVIQLDLPCRPCSVYGQKECFRNDWACMTQLSPEIVVKKVERALNQ